jgi:hypothetical protein
MMRPMIRGTCLTFFAALIAACGGAAANIRPMTIEPGPFLMEFGAETVDVLHRPDRSIEELQAARDAAQGAERRAAVRELVIANLFAAEDAHGRDARRIRRRTEELVDTALRRNRDQTVAAEMAFVRLWLSWRAGLRNAQTRAQNFTERFQSAGNLLMLAWMIRGEIAFDDEHYDDAITAFRFALGQLEHPLYGYALLRTAHAYQRMHRTEDANQAFSEVERLGCGRRVPPLVLRLSVIAANNHGTGVRTDPDDVTRPASCPVPNAQQEEEEGWHPEE